MTKARDPTAAAERSRWLAEVAETVDEALCLARKLGVPDGSCNRARELYERLELVRLEVEALRRGGPAAQPIEIDPLWTSLFPGIMIHKSGGGSN